MYEGRRPIQSNPITLPRRSLHRSTPTKLPHSSFTMVENLPKIEAPSSRLVRHKDPPLTGVNSQVRTGAAEQFAVCGAAARERIYRLITNGSRRQGVNGMMADHLQAISSRSFSHPPCADNARDTHQRSITPF